LFKAKSSMFLSSLCCSRLEVALVRHRRTGGDLSVVAERRKEASDFLLGVNDRGDKKRPPLAHLGALREDVICTSSRKRRQHPCFKEERGLRSVDSISLNGQLSPIYYLRVSGQKNFFFLAPARALLPRISQSCSSS